MNEEQLNFYIEQIQAQTRAMVAINAQIQEFGKQMDLRDVALRDQFAGQGLIAVMPRVLKLGGYTDEQQIKLAAKLAYIAADAMLEARKA